MNFFLLVEGVYSGCIIDGKTTEKGADKKNITICKRLVWLSLTMFGEKIEKACITTTYKGGVS